MHFNGLIGGDYHVTAQDLNAILCVLLITSFYCGRISFCLRIAVISWEKGEEKGFFILQAAIKQSMNSPIKHPQLVPTWVPFVFLPQSLSCAYLSNYYITFIIIITHDTRSRIQSTHHDRSEEIGEIIVNHCHPPPPPPPCRHHQSIHMTIIIRDVCACK